MAPRDSIQIGRWGEEAVQVETLAASPRLTCGDTRHRFFQCCSRDPQIAVERPTDCSQDLHEARLE